MGTKRRQTDWELSINKMKELFSRIPHQKIKTCEDEHICELITAEFQKLRDLRIQPRDRQRALGQFKSFVHLMKQKSNLFAAGMQNTLSVLEQELRD